MYKYKIKQVHMYSSAETLSLGIVVMVEPENVWKTNENTLSQVKIVHPIDWFKFTKWFYRWKMLTS